MCIRDRYFTSLRHSLANWFRRSDNTDVIPLKRNHMILRVGIFVVVLLWGAYTAIHLQCERQMECSRGGLYQFANQHSRGWPRNDAFSQHQHHVMAPDSVFGNIKYDRTASNQWKYLVLCFNLLFSALLVIGIILCLAKICFDRSTIQFSLSSLLIILTATSATIAIVLNEQQLHGFVFRDLSADFPFSPVRTLDSLNWNQRAFVVFGIFSVLLQGMIYFVRFQRSNRIADTAG